MFKNIYVEITNYCNMNCSFCSDNKKSKREMSVSEFDDVVKGINLYTDYLYLHVKGEPFMHSDIDGILGVCRKYNKRVNITTNGTLIKDNLDIILKYSDVIRQINISIHVMPNNKSYLDMVSDCVVDIINNSNIIVVYRLWNIVLDKDNNDNVYKYLKDRFDLDDLVYLHLKSDKNVKIKDRFYLNKDRVFIWPSLDNTYYSEVGKCYGTIRHVSILSDGTVVPCCLDADGVINLGNIFSTSFDDIINSKKFIEIKNGFINHKKVCLLCKKCSFLDK